MWVFLTPGEVNPGMNCNGQSSGSRLCVGIGKDGKGYFLQKNDQNKNQVWTKSNENGQFRNGVTGSSKCGDCKIGKEIQPTGLIYHGN